MRQPLYDALEALSQAHGYADVMRAIGVMRKAARRVRAAEDAEGGKLSAAVAEALEIRDRMKADGVTGQALDAGLEGVLRDTWPKGRAEAWKILCHECSDYGAIYVACPGDGTCGRGIGPHAPHEDVKGCWCSRGARFREAPKPDPSNFTDVGKAPRRGFARAGR